MLMPPRVVPIERGSGPGPSAIRLRRRPPGPVRGMFLAALAADEECRQPPVRSPRAPLRFPAPGAVTYCPAGVDAPDDAPDDADRPDRAPSRDPPRRVPRG